MRRPGHYVKRTGNLICEEIALGATLAEALEKVGYLAPSERQFWKWLELHEDFRLQYERARQMQADKLADDHLSLARKVLLLDAKQAPKFKTAADILRWQAEVRNRGKYSQKAEAPAKAPMKPEDIKAEIKRLEKELGVNQTGENVTPIHSVKNG